MHSMFINCEFVDKQWGRMVNDRRRDAILGENSIRQTHFFPFDKNIELNFWGHWVKTHQNHQLKYRLRTILQNPLDALKCS